MNQDYVDTVRLLLAVAPAVFRPTALRAQGISPGAGLDPLERIAVLLRDSAARS
jgi:hypothetical protein